MYFGAFLPSFPPNPLELHIQQHHLNFNQASQSRLRQLLLPEPPEEARTHDDLRNQADPEPRFFQTVQTNRQIREDGAGTSGVGSAGASDDGGDGSQDLRTHQGEDDVEARQRLEEDHAEADALDSV